jgi:ribosome-associated protein
VTEPRDLARLAAQAASSKQGQDVTIMDVSDLIGITDFFVIASGSTERQIATLAEEVERRLKPTAGKPVRREGESGARWLLLDYVDFVVHLFHEEEREFYRLENLWRDAPIVDWEEQAEVSSG